MRNIEEETHSEEKDILEQLNMCDILYVVRGLDEDIEYSESVGHDDDDYPASSKEFEVFNKHTVGDPLILTPDELRRLGQQFIEMANSVTT